MSQSLPPDPHAGEGGGVLHPAAVWASPEGSLEVMGIGPQTLQCPADRLALGYARARARVILTTGKILRDEPLLTHRLHPHEPTARALERRFPHRRQSVVLSSGRSLPTQHPLYRDRPLFMTPPDAPALPGPMERLPNLDCRVAVQRLLARGVDCLSVEAGPSTALCLYDAPVLVDELLLSIFEGPDLPPERRAGAFLTRGRIDALFSAPVHEQRVTTSSGSWRLLRFVRTS